MKLQLHCTCGRGRGDLPKLEKISKELHRCPYGYLIQGNREPGVVNGCNCCPSCTILCLPMKTIRDIEKLESEVADLYRSCIPKDKP